MRPQKLDTRRVPWLMVQARFGEDAYPLGRFLIDRAQALGLDRRDLVRRLGYTRIGKGHQALHTALVTGVAPPQIAGHLGQALQTDESVITAVLAATERQRRDEAGRDILARETDYWAAFKPHLRTETARFVPEPICVAALVGTARLRLVAMPDEVWLGAADQRDRALQRVIQDHYRESGGWVPAFGAIIGYTFVTLPGYRADFGFGFDLDGNRLGPMREVERLPEAGLGMKPRDTRLAGLLKKKQSTKPIIWPA